MACSRTADGLDTPERVAVGVRVPLKETLSQFEHRRDFLGPGGSVFVIFRPSDTWSIPHTVECTQHY